MISLTTVYTLFHDILAKLQKHLEEEKLDKLQLLFTLLSSSLLGFQSSGMWYTLLGNWFLPFWKKYVAFTFKGSRTLNPWRWWRHVPAQCWQPLTLKTRSFTVLAVTYPKDTFLHSVGSQLPRDAASHCKQPGSLFTPLWKSHTII